MRRILFVFLAVVGWSPAGADDLLTEAPLAERRAEKGPLFERLDRARTGLDFVHRYDVADERRRRLLATGFVGCGVCVGDYDGDGRPDLYVTSQDAGARLYRNLGGFRFEDVTRAAGVGAPGRWCSGAAFVDVDNDGDLDLSVSAYDAPNMLFINGGDGTFKDEAAARGLAHRGGSVNTVFADYDRDGDLDAYVVTYVGHGGARAKKLAEFKRRAALGLMFDPIIRDQFGQPSGLRPEARGLFLLIVGADGAPRVVEAGEPDRLYRNEGEGTFVDVTAAAGIEDEGFGYDALWWDFDGDEFPDLYVSNSKYLPDRLYRNNANGTFTEVLGDVLPHCGRSTKGVNAGDLDGDGRLDLVIADEAMRTRRERVASSSTSLATEWLDGMGPPRQVLRNSVFLSASASRFQEAAPVMGLAATGWAWTAACGDLDCDGRVDLFFATGMSRDYAHVDTRAGAKEKNPFYEGKPRAEPDAAFRNAGGLRFDERTEEWGLGGDTVSLGAVLADLDGDGDLDLVVSRFGEALGVYRNRGADGHRIVLRLVGGHSQKQGVGATVRVVAGGKTLVRQLSPSRGFLSAEEPLLHFGLGAAAVVDSLHIEWPSGHRQDFRRLAADKLYTVREPDARPPVESPFRPRATQFTERAPLDRMVHVEAPFAERGSAPLLPRSLARLGPGLAWGDVDGDGRDDLFLGGAAGMAGRLALQRDFGKFEIRVAPFTPDARCEDLAPLLFDADGDGDLDLYVVSGGVEAPAGFTAYADRLYRNDGKGAFTRDPKALPDLRDSGGTAVAADFDRDGDLDVFVGGRVVPNRYPLPARNRLLRNDGGTFTDATGAVAPGLGETGLVTAALWSDVDGDGWLDLLLAHEWGPVMIWRNEAGKLVDGTKAAGLAGRTGWWQGLAGGDVDNDGDIDYVVTNHGLNSRYRAPAVLFRGRFLGRRQPTLIEAEGAYPARSLPSLSRVFPGLSRRFPRMDTYADATLEDVFGAGAIKDAARFTAAELRTGVLLNDGRGVFTFRPLPLLAQAAPGYGVLLDDLDADGNADIYFVQNDFDAYGDAGPSTGGVGQYLVGNGDGSFTPRRAGDSGLIVAGAGKSVAVTDFNDDGWPDLAVGVTNAPVKLYRNAKSARGNPFRVTLVGPPGNPTAIGARVTLHRAGGEIQVQEVYAGSGYLGQSTARLFFGLGVVGRPQSVTVRWPDGTKTEHPVEVEERKVTISRRSE